MYIIFHLLSNIVQTDLWYELIGQLTQKFWWKFRQGTAIEWRYTDDGTRVRVSKRTGRIIPIPAADNETIDYKLPSLYKERPKDTIKADVEQITFKVISLFLFYCERAWENRTTGQNETFLPIFLRNEKTINSYHKWNGFSSPSSVRLRFALKLR